MMPKAKVRLTTPRDEVMARVREAAAWAAKTANHMATANITGIKLAYAGVGNDDPYAGFEARIVPENITLLPKTTNKTTGGNPFNEKVVVAKKDDSVGAILHKLGASNAEVIAITQAARPLRRIPGPARRPEAAHPVVAGARQQASSSRCA